MRDWKVPKGDAAAHSVAVVWRCILILMPDQMRGDCLSILEHPVVRTPQMDQLAREGVLFRRAYATVASCIPARYALLTGLYPQTSGGNRGASGTGPGFWDRAIHRW